jgi:hypothetical protein
MAMLYHSKSECTSDCVVSTVVCDMSIGRQVDLMQAGGVFVKVLQSGDDVVADTGEDQVYMMLRKGGTADATPWDKTLKYIDSFQWRCLNMTRP